jgi:TolB protein
MMRSWNAAASCSRLLLGAVAVLGACSALEPPGPADPEPGVTNAARPARSDPVVPRETPFATTPAVATCGPLEGRIAFVVDAGGANAIAAIDADGAGYATIVGPGPRRSQPHGGTETPRWTPSGDLLFGSNRAGGPDDWQLFRMEAAGSGPDPIEIPDSIEDHGVLSPDGLSLAFTRYPATGDAAEPFGPGSIFLAAPDGTSPRRLTAGPAGGSDEHPDFSPDGRWVAFSRVFDFTPGSARSAIFVIGVDGTGLTQLTDPALNGFHPRWSPQGELIAFSSNADNFATVASNVWVVAPDGSGERQVTNERQAFVPDWSPDGTWLAFTHLRAGQNRTDLGAVRVDGSDMCVLWKGSDASASEPDWRP